jgi:hypothetical protein
MNIPRSASPPSQICTPRRCAFRMFVLVLRRIVASSASGERPRSTRTVTAGATSSALSTKPRACRTTAMSPRPGGGWTLRYRTRSRTASSSSASRRDSSARDHGRRPRGRGERRRSHRATERAAAVPGIRQRCPVHPGARGARIASQRRLDLGPHAALLVGATDGGSHEAVPVQVGRLLADHEAIAAQSVPTWHLLDPLRPRRRPWIRHHSGTW